jgi:hypothetical protein
MTILLSGACGSGKSTLMTLGYRAFAAHWGATACIDTDTVLMMVDPRWELAHEERRLDLAGYQCWQLANSFLAGGFQSVVIVGNGLHTPEEGLNDLVSFLLTVSDVHHVTLDPSLEEIQRRVAERGSDHTAEWLEEHVEWMSARYRDWSCRIDTTTLSPQATLAELAKRIGRGEGRITALLPAL